MRVEVVQIKVRLPRKLAKELIEAAEKNERSLSAEVVYRIKQTLRSAQQ